MDTNTLIDTNRQIDKLTERQTDRLTNRHKQADRLINRQTDRQTDRREERGCVQSLGWFLYFPVCAVSVSVSK